MLDLIVHLSGMTNLENLNITTKTSVSEDFPYQAYIKNASKTYVNLTVDGEGRLHACMDVVCHMAVKEPRSRSSSYQFHSLKCSWEQVIHVSSVGVIGLREERRDINYRVDSVERLI